VSWAVVGRVIAVATTLVVLAILVRRLDVARVRTAAANIRWSWAVGAAVLNLLNTGIESIRWTLLASSVKPGVRVWSAFKGFLASALGNLILPFKLGEGVRAYAYAHAEDLPFASALSTVILDRTVDSSCFFALLILTAVAFPLPRAVSRASLIALVGLLVLIAGLEILARLRRRRARLSGAPASRAARVFSEFVAGLSALRRGGRLVPAVAAGLLSWGARSMVIWGAFQAFGLSLPLIAAPFTLIVINLGMALVGAPGNLGAFELAAVGALAVFSVPDAVGISFGFGCHMIELIPVITLGLVLVWTGQLVVRRPRGMPDAV